MNDILNIVEETDARLRGMNVNGDICPADDAAVFIRSAGGTKLSGIKWGYPGMNSFGLVINARVETVLDKKMFASGIRSRRAVILAKNFYEWNRNKEKNTFRRQWVALGIFLTKSVGTRICLH